MWETSWKWFHVLMSVQQKLITMLDKWSCIFPARLHTSGESLWPSRSPFCRTWRYSHSETVTELRKWKFQHCRSSHLEQSAGLQRTLSEWIENSFLPAGLQPLKSLCWSVYRTEVNIFVKMRMCARVWYWCWCTISSLLRPPYGIVQAIIFLLCGFFLLSSFFSSPNLSSRSSDVYRTSTHGVALVRI